MESNVHQSRNGLSLSDTDLQFPAPSSNQHSFDEDSTDMAQANPSASRQPAVPSRVQDIGQLFSHGANYTMVRNQIVEHISMQHFGSVPDLLQANTAASGQLAVPGRVQDIGQIFSHGANSTMLRNQIVGHISGQNLGSIPDLLQAKKAASGWQPAGQYSGFDLTAAADEIADNKMKSGSSSKKCRDDFKILKAENAKLNEENAKLNEENANNKSNFRRLNKTVGKLRGLLCKEMAKKKLQNKKIKKLEAKVIEVTENSKADKEKISYLEEENERLKDNKIFLLKKRFKGDNEGERCIMIPLEKMEFIITDTALFLKSK